MTTMTSPRRRSLPPRALPFAVFVGFQCVWVSALLLGGWALGPSLLLGLGVVVGLAWLCLMAIYPWLAVPLLMASTSLDTSGRLVKEVAAGIPVTGFHVSFLLMVVALLINAAMRRRMHFPTFELGPPLAMLLGLIALSLTWSPNEPEASISFIRMLMLSCFLYLTQVLIDTRAAVAGVVVTVSACVAAGSILGIVQMLTEKFFLPASFVIAAGANTPRATGTFHNPNDLGTFLMAGCLFLAAVLLNHRMNRLYQLLIFSAIGIGLAGLVATFSRANWLALAVGGVFLLGISGKLRLRYMIGSLVGVSVSLVLLQSVLPIAEYVITRFVSIFTLFTEFGSVGHVSGSARVQFVEAALGMWHDHPLLGAGWRAFPVILDPYKPEGFPHWIPTRECHTLFAAIMAELGLLGLLASCWIVWRVAKTGHAAMQEMEPGFLRAVMIGLLSLFVGFQVSLTFTNDLANNFLWFYTGMIFAVLALYRQEQVSAAPPVAAPGPAEAEDRALPESPPG